jgi:F420H(2)-dependent quinone reductase
MSISGEYEPSTWEWVRQQVADYEGSGGAQASTLRDTGLPIIIMTTIGHSTGKVRKVPLMRVEHKGEYAIVGSKGGAPKNPAWVANLEANPKVMIQDGPEPFDAVVRLLEDGPERAEWWARSVADFPPYAEYQAKTDRLIPVFIASPLA